MTMALCLDCGDVKFGALCPCPACQVSSSGNINLDIAFSDHHYALETLREFGAVIKVIHSSTTDAAVRFWAFIHYLSTAHPGILHADPPADLRAEVERVLRANALPAVTIREAPSVGPPHGGVDE